MTTEEDMLPEYIKALAVLETKLDHLIRSVDHREGLVSQLEKRLDEVEGYRKYMLGVIATLFTLSGVATYAVQQVAQQNSTRLSMFESTQEALCYEARSRKPTICYQREYSTNER
jgi:hypothetical protein